ncbi:MAG: PFL family protein [Planctomycetota bacterium]
MPFHDREILETFRMVETETLDIRTTTLGISLRNCVRSSVAATADAVRERILRAGSKLVETAEQVEAAYGIPIVNKRVAVTPVALIADSVAEDDLVPIARAMDEAAREIGVDYCGGFSALVQQGTTLGDRRLIASIPEALSSTERVCASVNVGTTRAGINFDACIQMARVIKETAERTADRNGIGCAKLVVFMNAVEDNPFIAGAMHGVGMPDEVINCGVSGPGVVRSVLQALGEKADLGAVAEAIKKTAFQITRMGELVGRETARRLGVPFGAVDLSLAPTPAKGDSIAEIIECFGLERCGAPGTILALAILNDAVKKGGVMAAARVGGLSGAFIPVSEDMGMVRAVVDGALSYEKLEAMTAVCSVGLDMVAVPGDVSVETIAAMLGDEMAIGMINNKTTAVRLLPIPGKKAGESVNFGGLLGVAQVMPINRFSAARLVQRGGHVPPPLNALTN